MKNNRFVVLLSTVLLLITFMMPGKEIFSAQAGTAIQPIYLTGSADADYLAGNNLMADRMGTTTAPDGQTTVYENVYTIFANKMWGNAANKYIRTQPHDVANIGNLVDGKITGITADSSADQRVTVGDTNHNKTGDDLSVYSTVHLVFDLGGPTQLERVVLGDSAKTMVRNKLWKGTLSVANSMDALFAADTTIATWSYEEANTGFYSATTDKKGVVFPLNSTVTGRYVAFEIPADTVNPPGYIVTLQEIAIFGTVQPQENKKVVCVGDSITYGHIFTNTQWAAKQEPNNYPVQLEGLLNSADSAVHYEVINAGISGSAIIGADQCVPGTDSTFPASQTGAPTTWLTEQERYGYVQQADTVLIMLGTNDAHDKNGTWDAREAYYEQFYKKVIDAFRAKNPMVDIYVLTSPYTSVSTHYSNLENRVVPLQKKLAAAWGLPCIDVYAATKHFVEVDNNGNLGAFIDAMDIQLGLKLHPHATGLGVIAQTVCDALTGEENDLYVMDAKGAQLRDYEGGAEELALRFATTVPVSHVTMDAAGNTQLSSDSTINIGGVRYTVVGMGSVVALADKIGNPVTELVAGQEKGYAKTVPAAKLYEVGDGTATFTAVVTGIGEDSRQAGLVSRGYVKYVDGDKTAYAYGPVHTRTAAGVLSDHLLDNYTPTYDQWNSFTRMTFTVNGVKGYLIAPETPVEGNPWLWRTEFFDVAGAARSTDIELLEKGWYVAYCAVSNQYGNPASVAAMKKFYDVAVPMAQLREKAVLLGVSRGGLYAVNYAAAHPATVAGMYLDAPVQDICSWPGGSVLGNGYTGDGGATEWTQAKACYGWASNAEALADRTASPIYKYDVLTRNRIPVLLVYGTKDTLVPFAENGQKLVDAYTSAGLTDILKVQSFDRGHAHGWDGAASTYIMDTMSN